MTNAVQETKVMDYFKVWIDDDKQKKEDDSLSLYAYRNPFGAAFSPILAFLYGVYKGGEERRKDLREDLLKELGATNELQKQLWNKLGDELTKSRPEAPAQAPEEREEAYPREMVEDMARRIDDLQKLSVYIPLILGYLEHLDKERRSQRERSAKYDLMPYIF